MQALYIIPELSKATLKCSDCVHFEGEDRGSGRCHAIKTEYMGLVFSSPTHGTLTRCQDKFQEMPF